MIDWRVSWTAPGLISFAGIEPNLALSSWADRGKDVLASPATPKTNRAGHGGLSNFDLTADPYRSMATKGKDISETMLIASIAVGYPDDAMI